jgi:hypothetical protein
MEDWLALRFGIGKCMKELGKEFTVEANFVDYGLLSPLRATALRARRRCCV